MNEKTLMDSSRRFAYTAAMLKNKRQAGLAALWILFIVVILSVFLAKKNTIVGNLEKTDFFGKVFGRTPEFINSRTEQPNGTEAGTPHGARTLPEERSAPFDLNMPNPEIPPYGGRADDAASEAIDTGTGITAPDDENALAAEDTASLSDFDAEASSSKQALPKMSLSPEKETTLCFIVVDSDGTVSRKFVKRNLPKSDSPLADAINALLAGPLQSEQDKNCMSLIPPGVRLLGASVKDGVAMLNFSETFEFNPLGIEGVIAQLMQVVYTATEFSTVKSVQFLIEGEHKDYLGSEGQWIGTPLARSSF